VTAQKHLFKKLINHMVAIDKTFCYNFRQKGVKLNSSHFSCASVSSLPPQSGTAHHTRRGAKFFFFITP
jgi:hypothetical protein